MSISSRNTNAGSTPLRAPSTNRLPRPHDRSRPTGARFISHQPAAAIDPVFVPSSYFRELRKEEIFPHSTAPLEVDLGCGEGHFVEAMAALHPERNFLAVERLQGRVRNTARRIRQLGLGNARVLRLESAYTVAWLLPTAAVCRVHLLCPDPWPKKKHHARRLINRPDFLAGLAKILEPDGEFLLKTDDRTYFENALESLDQPLAHEASPSSRFVRLPWEDDAFPYAPTGFERHWLNLGRCIHRARWQKVNLPLGL